MAQGGPSASTSRVSATKALTPHSTKIAQPSPVRSPPKKVILESEPVPLDLDSDDDFNEKEFVKEEPKQTKVKKTKAAAKPRQARTPVEGGDVQPKPPAPLPKRSAGVKNEVSTDDDSPSPKRRQAKIKAFKYKSHVSESADEDESWEKKGRVKAAKTKRREAGAKVANPLKVLAGESDSSESGASSDDPSSEPDQALPLAQPERKEMSGSETEDEEPAAVEPDEESEEDLADPDAWRKKDLPKRTVPPNNFAVTGSQYEPSTSQGSSSSHQASQTGPVPTSTAHRPGSKTTADHRPVELSPYTPEQLAMRSLPLTNKPDGPAVPQPLNRLLREYQREGVKFLYERWAAGKGAILGDDMGLGKTIQVISFLSAIMRKTGLRSVDDRRRNKRFTQLKAEGKFKSGLAATNPAPGSEWPTALIIAPSSVCYNWEREFATWGYFSVAVYAGSKHDVLLEYKKGWYDVVIVGFETASKDILELYDLDWGCIIADEVHKVKNPKATLTISLNKFHCRRRIGLTGTAIQNKLTEFWCILDWARPGELGDMKQFKSFISKPIAESQSHEADAETLRIGRHRAWQWTRKILPHFFLRRTKAIIAHQMPKKRDLVVSCRLTGQQLDCLRRLRDCEDVQLLLRKDEPCDCGRFGSHGERTSRKECCYKTNSAGVPANELMFKYVSAYRKTANHVALLLSSEDDTPQQRELNKGLAKIVLPDLPPEAVRYHAQSMDPALCCKWSNLQNLLAHWRPNHETNGNKVLIFSMSVKLLKIIEFFIQGEGHRYKFLHGGIPAPQRMQMVDEFQNDPDVYIFLISTLTGGVGLNLTAANKVVIFDPSWNPANDLQAMDRAFRIGQKSDVEVFRLIAAGSIEEIIYTRQIYKRQSSNIGYNATMEKRNFDGIMDDKDRQGELFGVVNLFSLREDGLGIKETAERVEEVELAVTGLAAGYQFREDGGEDLQFSQADDADTSPETILGVLNGSSDTSGDAEITRLLEASGATFTHEDDLFLGDNDIERHVYKAAKKTAKERPLEAGKISAYRNAETVQYEESKKKRKKPKQEDGPPGKTSPAKKKRMTKMPEEEKEAFLPAPRRSKIAELDLAQE